MVFKGDNFAIDWTETHSSIFMVSIYLFKRIANKSYQKLYLST